MRWNDDAGFWSRERTMALALFLVTAAILVLSLLLLRPFIPALAWAVGLAVVAHPVYRWLERKTGKPGVAAAIAVVLVATLVVAPAILVAHRITIEAATGVDKVRPMLTPEGWRSIQDKNPRLAPIMRRIERDVDMRQTVERTVATVSGAAMVFVRGSVRSVVELLIIFFALFYFFRDYRQCMATAASFLPLSRKEAHHVLVRLRDTIHAMVYGTVVISAVQGSLGGLMFWWLGLPSPVLWGVVMGLLAIVPVLGAFVVWIPAAIVLALQGAWVKAIILTIWGTVVIGLIDNLLYPMLVGRKLQLHTLGVFFAIVGGLMFFGAAGIILGPVVLALAGALIDIWRRRTSGGETIEESLAADKSHAANVQRGAAPIQ
jgi:predicted PurR-regulated permease PerM